MRSRRILWAHASDVRLLADTGVWVLAVLAGLLLGGGGLPGLPAVAGFAAVLAALHILAALALRSDRRSWRHAGARDLVHLGAGVGVAVAGAEALVLAGLTPSIPWTLPPVVGLAAFAGMVLFRAVANGRTGGPKRPLERILLVGASGAGPALARALRAEGHQVVGYLDDDATRRGLRIEGVPVRGPTGQAVAAALEARATHVVLAHSPPPPHWAQVRAQLEAAGVRVRWIPGIDELLGAEAPRQIQQVVRRLHSEHRPSNVLVVGGAGYIGSALVPMLLQAGYHVRVLDILLYGREPLDGVLGHPRLELLEGDFRNVSRLVEAMQGVDTVVHLGAIVGDPACALDEGLTVETNLMATKIVAEVAKGHGIRRFVFASTCSVYGASDGILDEESPLNPVSLYARTKVAAERILLRMKDETFCPIVLRFGTVYGFSGRTRFDLVVNLLAAKAVTSGAITLHGGSQWRPFIHVHDVAAAVARFLEAPAAALRHDVYNVGSDEQNYTLEAAARVIQGVVPAAQVVELGDGADRRNYRVSFRRLRDDLGFRPSWTLEAGVRQVVDAIRAGRVRDVQDPRYSNVRFLTEGGLSHLDARVYAGILDAMDEAVPAAAAS